LSFLTFNYMIKLSGMFSNKTVQLMNIHCKSLKFSIRFFLAVTYSTDERSIFFDLRF